MVERGLFLNFGRTEEPYSLRGCWAEGRLDCLAVLLRACVREEGGRGAGAAAFTAGVAPRVLREPRRQEEVLQEPWGHTQLLLPEAKLRQTVHRLSTVGSRPLGVGPGSRPLLENHRPVRPGAGRGLFSNAGLVYHWLASPPVSCWLRSLSKEVLVLEGPGETPSGVPTGGHACHRWWRWLLGEASAPRQ